MMQPLRGNGAARAWSGTTRLQSVDATRGAALLLMLLSHAAGAFGPVSDSRLPKALFEIGRIASPTFVMISGLLLGFLYRTTRPFAATRTKFIDRGLFLLTVGHLLLCGALRPHAHLARWLMLDVMGIALITGATLIPGIGRPWRLVLSAVVYTGSWLMIGLWHPTSIHSHVVKDVLFGDLQPAPITVDVFPLLPWLSVYFASSVLGERLALNDHSTKSRAIREVALISISCVALGLGAKLLLAAAQHFSGAPVPAGHIARALLGIGQKYPPAPVYLLFHGGIGLGLLAGCLAAEARGWSVRALGCAARLGQTSLFVFILHFYVYALGPFSRAGLSKGMWTMYFALSSTLIVALASLWQRRGYNRLITVGYGPLADRGSRSRFFVVPLQSLRALGRRSWTARRRADNGICAR